ncbi:hypothetical protein Tco_0707375 [Tanacetum coccineum]|uniref:Uncharacterized protein n=1 Tax=Tanacetum coccineum TaxID=301880 RepID=A0ABQ4YA13_9ASTR
MSITKEQQQALDDVLVPREQRLQIGSCYYRLSTTFKPKEPSFQVALGVLSHTPFYPAFLITTSVHAIYPKLPRQQFVDPLFEEEILTFMRELGYPENIKLLSDVKVDILPQPWRTFGTIIKKCLSAMKESEAYKTYYAFATGKAIPKLKYVRRTTKEKTVQASKASFGKRIKSAAKVTKSGKKKQPAQGLETLSEIALSKAEQMKIALERSKTQQHSSHVSGSGADEETGVKPGVPDVPTYESDDEQISWKSSEKEDDDEVAMNDDDDNDDDNDDADNQDDEGQKYDEHDEEEQEDKEEDSFDPRVQTPSYVESTDDEDSDEEIQGENVEGDKQDEKETNEEVESNELYKDMNVNLEGRDIEMTNAQQTNVQPTQETEDTHVIITAPVNPKGQQQSSSMSSSFVSNMLNHSPDTSIDSIFNLNTESTSLVDVPITSIVEAPLLDEAQAENTYFINKLDDNIKKIIKDQVKEQVKAQVSKILQKIKKIVNEQLKAEVLTCLSNKSKTSHAVAANLSELELEKILIDKMESNKRRDDEDKDEEPFAGSNQGSKRRRARKEPESTSAPKEKTSKTTGKSTEGSKSYHKFAGVTEDQPNEETSQLPDWFQKPAKPPTLDRDWNKTLPEAHGPIQPWLSSLAQMEDPCESFNELMDTPLDFSTFVMNRLKVNTLTPELLVGPTFELMKGTCKSLVKLEYFFEEVYKATTKKLDWNNLEGQQYPHDLRKPLPLIPNSRGRQVIPFYHFINNDLVYLCGGVSSQTYATSGRKRQQFYGFAANRESARDVYYKRRIIAVTKLQIVEWHGYKHLDWITIRREDVNLYTFKEGDFKRLRLQDIEDMLILLVQGKLTNLNVEERLAFSVSLRMFTRSIVIQRHVKDLQLGVESYQKKLNITKSDTYRSDLK